jgi:acylphosphatase
LEESPDMTAAAVRRRVIVRGRVQGVFFRDSLRRLDGAVEAVFEGPPDGVDALVRFAETGPPQARVESVETTDERVGGETEFRVR